MKVYIRILIFILITSVVFITFFHPIQEINHDLGFHLSIGKIIYTTHNIPTTNLFSYAFKNHSFINNGWLSELIFYIVYLAFGFLGLLILISVVAAAAFDLIFFQALKKFNYLVCFGAALVYLQIYLIRTELRPEIFSYFLTAYFVFVLFNFRHKYTKWIYTLPIAQLLWVNMHIYFPVGIILLILFLIDLYFLDKSFSKRVKALLIVFGLLLIAICINPNFIMGAIYPISVFTNHSYNAYIITENNPFWDIIQYLGGWTTTFLGVAAFLFITLFIFTFKKLRLIDKLLFIVFIPFSLVAFRNTPISLIATFLSFCYMLNLAYHSFAKIFDKKYIFQAILFLLFSGLLIYGLILNINTHGVGYKLNEEGKGGADFFVQNNIKGPLFNDFDVGSYLDYRLYPKVQVLIDARAEAYSSQFFQNFYIPVLENIKYFKQAENYYHYNAIFFTHADEAIWSKEFLKQIVKQPEWKIVYLDYYSIILVRDVPQNKELIKKYQISESTFTIPENLSEQQLLQFMSFFKYISWKTQEKDAELRIIKMDPNNCEALNNLTKLLLSEHDQNSTEYIEKWQLYCHGT